MLQPDKKKLLDQNIRKMLENGASEQDVLAYSNDFNQKFSEKKKDGSNAPSSSSTIQKPTLESEMPKENGSSVTPPIRTLKKDEKLYTEKNIPSEKTIPKVSPLPQNLKNVITNPENVANFENKKKEELIKFRNSTQVDEIDQIEIQKELEAKKTNSGVINKIKSGFSSLGDYFTSGGIFGSGDLLKDEKKEAKNTLIKQGIKNPTLEQVDKLADEIYIQKQTDIKRQDKTNEYLSNLDPLTKNLLENDAEEKFQTTSKLTKDITNRISANEKVGLEYVKELESGDLPEQEQELLKQEIIKIAKQIDADQKLYVSRFDELGTYADEFNAFKRNYDAVSNFSGRAYQSIANAGIGFIEGLEFVGTLGSPDPQVLEDTNKMRQEVSKVSEKLRPELQEITADNFMSYASDLLANQSGTLLAIGTTGGVGGATILGVGGAGEKYSEMYQENKKGAKFTPLQMATASLASGVSTAIFSELPTAKTLLSTKRIFMSAINDGKKEMIDQAVKGTSSKILQELSKNYKREISTELMDNLVQNAIDKDILGRKDVGYFDNSLKVLQDTALMTTMFSSGALPHVVVSGVKMFTKKGEAKTLDENSKKIIELSKELSNENLDDVSRKVIEKEIDKATLESETIVTSTLEKMSNLDESEVKQVVENTKKSEELKEQAKAINENESIEPKRKEVLLDGLKNEFVEIQKQSEEIIAKEPIAVAENTTTQTSTPTSTEVATPSVQSNITFKLKEKDTFYHASGSKRQGRLKLSNAPQFGTGVYFSSDKNLVESEFGTENTTEAKLNIKNPVYTNTDQWNEVEKLAIEMADKDYGEKKRLVLDEEKGYFRYDKENASELAEIPSKFISDASKKLGYDAIIDEGSSQYTDEIVVLDESKIIYPEDEKLQNPNTPTDGDVSMRTEPNVSQRENNKLQPTTDTRTSKSEVEVKKEPTLEDISTFLTEKFKQNEPTTETKTNAPTEGGGLQENITVPQEQKVKKLSQRGKTPLDKRKIKDVEMVSALNIEAYDAYSLAQKYFISGGRVLTDDVKKLFNSGEEARLRQQYARTKENKGSTIDAIANSLWEEYGEMLNLDTEDFRNAVEEVVSSFLSPKSMAVDLNSRFGIKYDPQNIDFDQDYEALKSLDIASQEEHNTAISYLDVLTDEEIIRLAEEQADFEEFLANEKNKQSSPSKKKNYEMTRKEYDSVRKKINDLLSNAKIMRSRFKSVEDARENNWDEESISKWIEYGNIGKEGFSLTYDAMMRNESSNGNVISKEVFNSEPELKGESILYSPTTDKAVTIVDSENKGGRNSAYVNDFIENNPTISDKQQRKDKANAEVDKIADKIKKALPGIKDPDVKAQGLSQDAIIDLIASAVKNLINSGIEIDEAIKQVVSSLKERFGDLGFDIDQNKIKAIVNPDPNDSNLNDFEKAIKSIPISGIVKKYLSGETIEEVYGTPENPQEYDSKILFDLGRHGEEVVSKAKELFGVNYIEKSLEALDSSNLNSFEKAIQYVALMNEVDLRLQNNPNNITDKKLQKLIYAKYQKNARIGSLTINAGRLMNIMKNGIDVNKQAEKILSSKEKEAKSEIEKIIQVTPEQINEFEDSANDEIEETKENLLKYTQEDFNNELRKAIQEYEKRNSESRKKTLSQSGKDVADKIRSLKLGKGQARADLSLGVYDLAIEAIAQLVEKGSTIAEAIAEVVKNKSFKGITEERLTEDILGGVSNKQKRVISEETKRKIYIKLLNKYIDALDEQIANGERNVVEKVDKYKNDTEIQNLREIKKSKQEQLAKIDPTYSQRNKLKKDLELAQKSLDEYQRRIDENDFSAKEKEKKDIDSNLENLRNKRDEKRKEYQKAKSNFEKSLKEDYKKSDEEIFNEKVQKRIEELEKRKSDLEDNIKKDNTGKNSIWTKEISDLQNQISDLKKAKKSETKSKVEKSIKDTVKELLIEAGFSREVKSKGETKVFFDWKKLAGEEGSVDKIKENVENVLKSKNYSKNQIEDASKEFESEYNRLSEEIINKGLAELENRNLIKPSPNRKIEAKRLAELFNYGLMESDSVQYDNIMNKVLGLSDLDAQSYQKIKNATKALADIFNAKRTQGRLTEGAVSSLTNQINHNIKTILHDQAFRNASKRYKIANVASEFAGLAQKSLLENPGNALENVLSGIYASVVARASGTLKKELTPEMRKQNATNAKVIFDDINTNAGLFYGDTNTSLITQSRIEEWLNGKSDNRLYHAILSFLTGRIYLQASDSMAKSDITNTYFAKNIIEILTHKSNPAGQMTTEEALLYISDNTTGVKFDEALVEAKKIIDEINGKQTEKQIADTPQAIHRFAMDIVRDNLISGGRMTKDQVEKAYVAGYKSAGRDIGHVANNWISASVNYLNSNLQTMLENSIKEKEWDRATLLTLTSIITKNIMNPFVGGGTNWIVRNATKAGIANPLSVINLISDYAMRKPIDLSTETGRKHLEEALYRKANLQSTTATALVGTTIALMTFALMKYGDDEEENLLTLNEWLKKNEWAKKYFEKLSPETATVMIALENKELGEHYIKSLGMKTDYFDQNMVLLRSLDKDNQSSLGIGASIATSPFSTPGPWRMYRDIQNIKMGLNGVPIVKSEHRITSFWNGVFKGGFIDYMGLRPNAVYGTKEELEQAKKDRKKEENRSGGRPNKPKTPTGF